MRQTLAVAAAFVAVTICALGAMDIATLAGRHSGTQGGTPHRRLLNDCF